MDMVALRKIVRISEKRRFVEPWMTTGIEESSRKKLRLYKKSIMATATENDIQVYKTYGNVHNRLKRETMMTYYKAKCNEYKTNT